MSNKRALLWHNQYAIFFNMNSNFDFIPSGTVTSPQGFTAGATCAGIKKENKPDLAILASRVPGIAAGVFTRNRIKAAPVVLCQQRLAGGKAAGVVVNSGCANACTGEQGLADAGEMTELAAAAIGASPGQVLAASTGVIGEMMPMAQIRSGIKKITLSREGGHDLARAIMTTDTVPKETAVKVEEGGYTIGGAAKGAGMIHPDMATFLGFLTTDARVEPAFLQSALKQAADVSFNMVSIDGDTSTNDTVLLLANGLAGNGIIAAGTEGAVVFQQALEALCIHLAKALALDGEGATKLFEVTVKGAPDQAAARQVARTVVSSPLVKAALYGNDPNWGRIMAAAGRSGVEIVESKIDLYLGDICMLKAGRPQPFDHAEAVKQMDRTEVAFTLDLNIGNGSAVAWGCDLTENYAEINSHYTT
jgi:glutamate N-acetyltransferase/amino-acid N-acetyltransferase